MPGAGFHVAFAATDREAVARFYEAALEHGGRDNGPPGLRPQYGEHYYAAFVFDPDGYAIEAVTGGRSRAADDRIGEPFMNDEKITVRVTSTGQTLDVVVLSKRAEVIEVVLGEGVHNVRCQLHPTRNGLAYAGSAMGREIVYERGRAQVKADLERANVGRVDYKR